MTQNNVLVILYSAFGDLALCLPALQAVKQHHPGAQLVFLTRQNMADNIKPFNIFSDFLIDRRERPLGASKNEFGKFIARMNQRKFSHVYDLHNNDRSRMHRLFLKLHQPRARVTAFHRQKLELYRPVRNPVNKPFNEAIGDFLRQCGVKPVAADLSAVGEPDAALVAALPENFAILAPGGSIARGKNSRLWPPRSIKMWPARNFAEIARRLHLNGVQPLVVGLEAERNSFNVIRDACPQAIDMLGKTDAAAFIHLGRRAKLMVAGDTGAAHWANLGGASIVSLFGAKPPATVWAPPGATVIQREPLPLLEADEVWQVVEQTLNRPQKPK
ncbi:MAG: hypothetical protein MPJ52_03210 [Alphaproteobacteria bacterium]|nr:hypothetical protein [Alphaproteobacteria bacterium]MDA7987353.1 hypothetical protein [Alphaproteobacteria bacterium]